MKIALLRDGGRGFTGEDFHGPGVGGTEAATVVLAEGLARGGHSVVVASPIAEPAMERGVNYVPVPMVRGMAVDLLVLVKNWTTVAIEVSARRRAFFWMDVHSTKTDELMKTMYWADRVLVMSPFAAECLVKLGIYLSGDRQRVLGLPVNTSDYLERDTPRKNLVLYCSVPDRGLLHLRRIWPQIQRAVPDAELVITSDFNLWGRPAARRAFEPFFSDLKNVKYLGCVPRSELVEWQYRAKVMAYPCHFEEGFCISAAECMAAGCVPVTTDAFALSTTVGEAGVLIPGVPHRFSFLYRRRFVAATIRLLTDSVEWQRKSAACQAAAKSEFDPDRYARTFLEACYG